MARIAPSARNGTHEGGTPPPYAPDARPDRDGDDGGLERQAEELHGRVQTLESEVERAHAILDGITDQAIFTLNLGGRITGWYRGAECITGYGRDAVLGRSGAFLRPFEDRAGQAFAGELCLAMEAGQAAIERWHVRRDGERFWASGSLLPMLDGRGRVGGFLYIFRDATAARPEAAGAEDGTSPSLALARAVAGRVLRQAGVAEEVRETLDARLTALGEASGKALRWRKWRRAPCIPAGVPGA